MYLFYVGSLCLCVCIGMCLVLHRGQKKDLDLPGLAFQTVVNHYVGLGGS